MKLSKQTHQKFEIFFRHFFDDQDLLLPRANVYAKSGAALITKIIRVDGITIGRNIFINPKLAKNNSGDTTTISKNLLAHELTHVIQYQRLGFIGFLIDYLNEYFRGLRRKKKLTNQARLEAYWEISHEKEARLAAAKFVEWHLELPISSKYPSSVSNLDPKS